MNCVLVMGIDIWFWIFLDILLGGWYVFLIGAKRVTKNYGFVYFVFIYDGKSLEIAVASAVNTGQESGSLNIFWNSLYTTAAPIPESF